MTGMGCAATCIGYELTADLDFDSNRDGYVTSGDPYWNNNEGWLPIRDYTATFDGSYHTISNLYINRTGNKLGLFGSIESGSVIRNVGLIDVNIISGGSRVGAIVGEVAAGGTVSKVYATGRIKFPASKNYDIVHVGGLVGELGGTLQASWADVYVRGCTTLGGLYGEAVPDGTVLTASYSLGDVFSRCPNSDKPGKIYYGGIDVGGLYGRERSATTITDSYYARSAIVRFYYDDPERTIGRDTSRTTAQLQNPTGYTGIYQNWNLDLDGDGTGDDPWDFGTSSQYPALKGDRNNDGVFTWEEFGDQGRVDYPAVSIGAAQAVVTEGQTARFTVAIDPAPAEAVTLSLHVTAGGDFGVAAGAGTITIPANRRSVTYTVSTTNDATDERAGWVQVTLQHAHGYDLAASLARVNINDDDPPSAGAPRLPQVTPSLESETTRTARSISRPGRFSLYVIPDDGRQARTAQEEHPDYYASLEYKWEQISGPVGLGPPLLGGCEKRLPGHPEGASTYCVYSLYSAEQSLSWIVWDGVTRPSEYRSRGGQDDPASPTPANRPGDYVFRLTVTDPATGDVYTAPQTVTVTVADETGAASGPTAVGRVTTSSRHPQGAYTVIEAGKGPDGVYGGGDDTVRRTSCGPDRRCNTADDVHETRDKGPDEIVGTDDDNVLIVGPDGRPCTDDDTLACGEDGRPGTADDKLNLGADRRVGTADDNTEVVEPVGNALQTPERKVTLSGSGSSASSGRSIRSYAWRQICLHPDSFGLHKLLAYDLLLQGRGSCGVDVELSRVTGSTTTFTTPDLPAMVRRVSADIAGTETTTTEDSVNLFFLLTVTDSGGAQDYDIVKVVVEEAPEVIADVAPIARATATYEGSPGRPALENTLVTLNGASSRARQGSIAGYQWTQMSGPAVELSGSAGSRATFTTPTGQTADMAYAFLLRVKDTAGSSDSAVVRIGVRARPTAAMEFTTNVEDVTWSAGDVVAMRGTIGGYSGETLTYTWSSVPASLNNVAWSGDLTGTVDGPGGRVTTNFTLPCLTAETPYIFKFTVSDNTSPAVTTQRTLTVNANPDGCSAGAGGNSGGPGTDPAPPEEVQQASVAPTANAGPDLTGAPGDSVTLQGITSINPYGEWWEMEHQWTQLSGPTVTLTHPQTGLVNQVASKFGDPRFIVPADAAGGTTLELQLTVTDKEGESDSDTVVITVVAPAPPTGESGQPPPQNAESQVEPENTPVTACFTDLNELTAAAGLSGAWDDPECRAHHQADSPARYIHFTVSEETEVSITLTSESGGALFVSKGTPQNDWGTPPNATYEHRVNVRLANGKLLHADGTTVTLTLAPGETYTVEAASTSDGGTFTLSIEPQ